jgi:hypothetical protein
MGVGGNLARVTHPDFNSAISAFLRAPIQSGLFTFLFIRSGLALSWHLETVSAGSVMSRLQRPDRRIETLRHSLPLISWLWSTLNMPRRSPPSALKLVPGPTPERG